MNSAVQEFIYCIEKEAPTGNKSLLETLCVEKFRLTRDRKVFHNDSFAVRFCYTKNKSATFSNTVLSLSALEKYDHIPFFVVLVRREGANVMFMANSTFLKKISHSSKALAMDNIVGSFNGSDIIRDFNGIQNVSEHFNELWACHSGMEWSDNLERLVESTRNVTPRKSRFEPNSQDLSNIYDSVQRAEDFVDSADFNKLFGDLNDRCLSCAAEIQIAAHIENTNIRGRLIEVLITSDPEQRKSLLQQLARIETELPKYDTRNGLGDYVVKFKHRDVYTDIKTKILYLNSNPKAYNIDKFLAHMAQERSVFMIFLIGIDETGAISTKLCSVYHDELLENTLIQTHWTGRASRGVTQFNGVALNRILSERNFKNKINKIVASAFLDKILNI